MVVPNQTEVFHCVNNHRTERQPCPRPPSHRTQEQLDTGKGLLGSWALGLNAACAVLAHACFLPDHRHRRLVLRGPPPGGPWP